MVDCRFLKDAESDLFGFGVRLGYYLQWTAWIIEDQCLDPDKRIVRLGLAIWMFASFLAIVIRAIENGSITGSDLRRDNAVVMYINLLLTFAFWFKLIPKFTLGIIAQFVPKWRLHWKANIFPIQDKDDDQKNKETVFEKLWLILLIVVNAFLIYFWAQLVKDVDNKTCPRYGFLFTKIRLQNRGFQDFNLACSVALLVGLVVAFIQQQKDPSSPDETKFWSKVGDLFKPRSQRNVISWWSDLIQLYTDFERQFDNMIKLFVIVFIVIGTELTISWNNIAGAYTLRSSGQLIALVIGTVTLLRVIINRNEKAANERIVKVGRFWK